MEITIEGNIAEIEGLIKALRIRPETGPYTPVTLGGAMLLHWEQQQRKGIWEAMKHMDEEEKNNAND